jgi:hypothetical protein
MLVILDRSMTSPLRRISLDIFPLNRCDNAARSVLLPHPLRLTGMKVWKLPIKFQASPGAEQRGHRSRLNSSLHYKSKWQQAVICRQHSPELLNLPSLRMTSSSVVDCRPRNPFRTFRVTLKLTSKSKTSFPPAAYIVAKGFVRIVLWIISGTNKHKAPKITSFFL